MQFTLTKEYIESLTNLIEQNDKSLIKFMINDLHAEDIAEIYDQLTIDQAKVLFFLLDKDTAADVVAELEESQRSKFLKELPSDLIAHQFIDEMDSDDAADVLGGLPEDKKEEILQHISDVDQAGDIVDLLNYDEDTAGGLMAKELVTANENWNVTTCITEIRKQAEEVDELYFIYVVDDDHILKGTLSLKKLLLSNSATKIASIQQSETISVKTDTDSEEVAHIMDKYDLVSLPVIDDIGRLMGRITIDDIVDVIKEEAEKDYQLASGITSDVEYSEKVWPLTKARLPWLLLGLLGGLLGAWVMSGYESELSAFPKLAFFAPLIAAMGGNAGVQSSSIIVQGIAAKTLGLGGTSKKMGKEFLIALINAIILSTLIIGITYLLLEDINLTIIIGTSLFTVIICATLFGALIPLLLQNWKIDPALATGPFITTFNDIMGLLIYFMIARFIFGTY